MAARLRRCARLGASLRRAAPRAAPSSFTRGCASSAAAPSSGAQRAAQAQAPHTPPSHHGLARPLLALAAASAAALVAVEGGDALRRGARDAANAAGAATALTHATLAQVFAAAAAAAPDGAGLLADFAADPKRRDALLTAGNGAVVDWLLRTAGGADAPAASLARRALATLLGARGAGEALLWRSGSSGSLLAALRSERAAPPDGAAHPDALARAALACAAAAQPPAQPPSDADAAAAVSAALPGGDDAAAALGGLLLAGWACASARGAVAVAAAGGADALAVLAASPAPAPPAARAAAARGLEALLRDAGVTLPRGAAAALASAAGAGIAARDAPLAAAATRALTLAVCSDDAAANDAMSALAPLLAPLATAQAAADAESDDDAAALALASARAVQAAAARGALLDEARRAWTPLLLRWSAAPPARPEVGPLVPDADSDAPDAPDAAMPPPRAPPPLRGAAQAALAAACDASDAAAALTAHSWLASLLRALSAASAGWAPRVVADDAATAADAAAAALEAAVAAAAPPPPPPPGGEPRRLYGLLPPAAPAAPPAPASSADAAVGAAAAAALHVGLKALAVLLAAEPSLAPAALDSGALTLLARFTRAAPLRAPAPKSDSADASSADPDEAPPEHVQRQLARCVAALSLLPAASTPLRAPPWDAWLAAAVRAAADAPSPCTSGTRKLASHARRAQLNAAAAAPGAPPGAPRFADGLFFFVPTARNLAPHPGAPAYGSAAADPAATADDATPCAPLCDVVFVHGLRGGPYGTWRAGAPPDDTDSSARRRQPTPLWPADWLAADAPGCRVMSVGYRTRYSDWEGATHGLEALADALLEKLTAAGVGAGGRPLMLVGHSLGGVLIKLLLARAAEPEHAARHGAVAAALRAAVFFSCPHFGSRLAELGAWRVLRPAPGVAELRPGGARLEALNDTLRAAHKRAGVRVLSFLEGTPTRLLRVPVFRGRHIAAEVVAMESAYPGFGEMVVLPESDHIDACKPRSREEASYERVLAMLREVLAERAKREATS